MTKRGYRVNIPCLVTFLLIIFFLNSSFASAYGACCANALARELGIPFCSAENPNLVSQEMCCNIFNPNWDTSGNPLIPDSLQQCQNEYYDAGPLTDCKLSAKTYVQSICSITTTTTTTTTTEGTLPPTTLPPTTLPPTTLPPTTLPPTTLPPTTLPPGSTTSSTTTTTIGTIIGEICNNGIDDNSNGFIDCADGYCLATRAICDPTKNSNKCEWTPDNSGATYKCCAFAQSCDSNNYKETCGQCSCDTQQERPQNPTISHVLGKYKLNLAWQMPCTGTTKFDIYRCEGTACNPVEKRNNQPVTLLNFQDTVQKPLTTYCYQVRANYGWVQKVSDIVCTATGDKECLGMLIPGSEFCDPQERPTLRMNCNQYNRKQQIEDCTAAPNGGSWRCFGPYMDSGSYKTKCVKHNNCDLCNYLFKFFGNPVFSVIGSPPKNCGLDEFCYYDNSQTIANQFYDCGVVTGGKGCYEYRSKEACVESGLQGPNGEPALSNNRCLINRNCTWKWISEPLGVGVCSEQDPALQKCELCIDKDAAGQFKPNAVFSLCTVDACLKYGDCYAKDLDGDGTISNFNATYGTAGEACLNKRQVSCETFGQNDCVNNADSIYKNEGPRPQAILVDVTYNDAVLKEKRVSGTNSILKHSFDYFDFGVCSYSATNKCFKDRDYDAKKDPNPLDMVSPRTVIGNNLVMQTLQIPFQVVDENPAGIPCTLGTTSCTGSQALYTCIVNSTTPPCYPKNTTTTATVGTGVLGIYSTTGNGTYKLYYYGIDRANNLEVVKYVNITVDREPPTINLTPPYFVYKAEAVPYNDSNVTIFVTVNEYSKCTDSFYTTTSAYKRKMSNANGTFFVANYSNLSDGYYAYRITCADAFGNSATLNSNIRIDADTRITDIYPNGTIDTKNATLLVKTRSRVSYCKYKEAGSAIWNNLEVEKEGNNHLYWNYSHLLTNLADGDKQYDINCLINGAFATEKIRFTLDTTPPTTAALDENGDPYDFTRPKQSHQVYLKCSDSPKDPTSFAEIGYLCDKTWYCIGASACDPTTSYVANPPTAPITINSGSYFCYKSREKTRTYLGKVMGGKNETVTCVSLITDKIVPYLYVDVLDKVAANQYYLANQNPLRISGRIFDPAYDSSVTGSTWPATVSASSYVENSVTLADFNLTTSLSFTGDYAEFWFRYVDANNYYALRIDNLDRFPGQQKLAVKKKVGGTDIIIQNIPGLTIYEGKTINLAVRMQGQSFYMRANSTTFNREISFTDSSFASGKIGARAASSSTVSFTKILANDYNSVGLNRIFMQPEGGAAYTKIGLANWETFAFNVTLPGNFSNCKKCTKITADAYDRANNKRPKAYLVFLDQNGPFFDNASFKRYNASNTLVTNVEFGSNISIEIRVYDTNSNNIKVNVTNVSVTFGNNVFYNMVNTTRNRYNTPWKVWLTTDELEPGKYNLTFRARDTLGNINSTVVHQALTVKDTRAPRFNITVYRDGTTTPTTVVGRGPYWVVVKANEPSNISSLNITNTFGAPTITINLESQNEYRTSWNGIFIINSVEYLDKEEKVLTFRLKAKDNHNNSQTLIVPPTLILNTTGPRAPIFDPAINGQLNGAYDDVYPDYMSAYPAEIPPVFYTNKPMLFMTGASQGSAKANIKIENSYNTDPLVANYLQHPARELMSTITLNAAGKGVRQAASSSTSIMFYYDLRNEPIAAAGNYLMFAGHDRKAYGSYKKFYRVNGSSWDGQKTTITIAPGLEQNVAEAEVVRVYNNSAFGEWFGLYTAAFSPGNNTLYATATDAIGNEGNNSLKYKIFFDNSSPDAVTAFPQAGWAIGNQSVNITLTVKDLRPSSRMRLADTNITIYYTNITGSYRLYSGQFTKIIDINDSDTNHNYSRFDFDTEQLFNVGLNRHFWPLQNGKYNVTVLLRDRARNLLTARWVFYMHLGVPDMPLVSLTDLPSNPYNNSYDLFTKTKGNEDYYFFTKTAGGFGFRLNYPAERNINLSYIRLTPRNANISCNKVNNITFNCLFSNALNQNTVYKINFTANRVLSASNLGPQATNSFYIVTDSQLPQISRIDAANLTRSGATLVVGLIGNSEKFHVNASVYINNVLRANALSNSTTIRFNNVSVQNLPDGVYELKALLLDQAGNQFTKIAQIRVDTTPPQLAVSDATATTLSKGIRRINPSTWITGDSNVSIAGTYVEPTIDYVCYINRNAGRLTCDNETGAAQLLPGSRFMLYSYIYGLENGTNVNNTITIVGADKAGNRANILINVVADRTPPIMSLLEPPGGYTSSARPLIKLKTSENSTCNLTYNPSGSTPVSANMAVLNGGFNHTHQVTADLVANSPTGTGVDVECKDELGSARIQSYKINVDTIKPTISTVTVTQGNRDTTTPLVNTYLVYSQFAEPRIVVTANEPVICKFGTANNYATMMKFPGYDAKTYSVSQTSNSTKSLLILNVIVPFYVICEDRSGNLADPYSLNIKLDPNAPIMPFNPKPVGHVNVRNPVASVNTYRPANCNITGATARNAPMTPRITVIENQLYNYTYNFYNLQEDVTYNINVTCWASPATTITFSFTVDTTGPTADIDIESGSYKPRIYANYYEDIVVTQTSLAKGAVATGLTGQNISARRFMYTPVANLTAGQYTFSITATDAQHNPKATTKAFTVPMDYVNMTLIKPRGGISATPTFEVIVGTDRTATCRYSILVDPIYANKNLQFTTTDGRTHRIDDYNYTAGKAKIYVRCADSWGTATTSSLAVTFTVDTDPPTLTTVSVNPAAITEPRILDGMMQAYTTLSVVANKASLCRYSQTQQNYNQMEYNMSGSGASHTSNIVVVNPPDASQSYTYYVQCESLAGVKSELKTVSFTVDMNAALAISNIRPPSNSYITNGLNREINISTNRLAKCTMTATSIINYSARTLTYTLNHQFNLPTPLTREGTYSFAILCNDSANNIASASTSLIFVKTPPTTPEIVYLYSCTGKEIFLKARSEDNLSGIVGYNISLEDDTNSTMLITKQQFDGDEEQIFRLRYDRRGKALKLDWTHEYILNIWSYSGAFLSSAAENEQFSVDPEDTHCSTIVVPCTGANCNNKHCENTITETNETDKNCGGVCVKEGLKCSTGEKCLANTDCDSNYCNPSTKKCDVSLCQNSQPDSANGETDVDCGGGVCLGCNTGKTCRLDSDCKAGADIYCDPSNYKCTEKSCTDKQKNQHDSSYETDVDCGGPCVAEGKLCPVSNVCSIDSDCESGFCQPITKLCTIPTCNDDYQNQDEAGLNCGGVCSAQGMKCADGLSCNSNDDCVSNYCTARQCSQSPNLDTDGDGIPDNWEKEHRMDATNPADAALNGDSDGLTNYDEYKRGTDLSNKDTDGDGYSDGTEVTANTDPLDPNSFPKKSNVFRTILLILIFLIIIAGAIYLAYTELRKMGGLSGKKKPLAPPTDFSRQRTLDIMNRPSLASTREPSAREELLPKAPPGALVAKKIIKDQQKSEQMKRLFGAFGGEAPVEKPAEMPAEKPTQAAAGEDASGKWLLLRPTRAKKAETSHDDIFKKLSRIAKQKTTKSDKTDVFKELSKIAKKK